jgi:cell division septum initiation protein DivIVA
MTDHAAHNDESRRRLAAMAERIAGGDPSLPMVGNWTPGAILCHLAFWDRLVEARWMRAKELGQSIPEATPPWMSQLLNDAAAHAWLTLTPVQAAKLSGEAAEAVDALVADVTDAQVAELEAAGMGRLADRAHHRTKHLNALEGLPEEH